MSIKRTSPEAQGIDSAAILRFVEMLESRVHEIHSLMLLRHGCVVAEGWWTPYAPAYPHMLYSLSKSFTVTAVGLAMAEGHFALDDLVLPFFPEEAPATLNDLLAGMQVRHLLTMSTGHGEDTWATMLNRPDGNWIKGFFEVPIVHAPGTHFLYNTGASYILSAIVQKTTGQKVIDYLQPRLFEPLGIENVTWDESPQGINMGGIGLNAKTEDLARFGQLYLQKGRWQGKQILPEEWVEAATTLQITNGDMAESDWAQGYGYQFWRCRHGAYRGDGVFGQYCVIMPEQDAVLALTGGLDVFEMQEPLDLVWEILLPAMGAEPLPENPTDHTTLAQKLSSLSLTPVAGQATSPITTEISGQTYRFDNNELKLETIVLNFTETGCIITTSHDSEPIACGYGTWALGQTALFNELGFAQPVAVSGAWTATDTFTVIVRLYTTPFYHTLVFSFVDTELLLESRVNASLEAVKTLLLTAHLA